MKNGAGVLVALLFLCGQLGAQSTTLAAASPTLLSRSVVFNYPETDPYDPGNRYGFNHAPSVVRMANGDLLCVWFSGPYEGAVNQVILGSRSRDGGLTWDKAFVLNRAAHKSNFDPAFIADGNRTWIFFTMGRWDRYPPVDSEHQDEIGVRSYHTFYRQTSDSGQTWSEPIGFPGTFFCRSNGIKLTTGELLLPVYTAKENGDEDKDRALRSTDGGKSWTLGDGISSPGGTDEPTIVEVSGGRVLMILRTRDGFIWRTYSSDKGQTWSEAVKSALPAAASSSNLFRLRDGRIALTHSPCRPPLRTPLTIRISDDDGQTWGSPLLLAESLPRPKASEHQVTYPSVTQIADGTLVVVWTEILITENEQYGNIWSARVRVPAISQP
jgi:predicted neuraminidase